MQDNKSETSRTEKGLDNVHFIWVGGDLPEKYLDNVNEFAAKALQDGRKVNLWVNDAKQFRHTEVKADRKLLPNVRIRSINELIPSVNEIFKEDTCLSKAGKKIPATQEIIALIRSEMVGNRNFSAVADWLRCLILLKEGGMYVDIDHKFTKLDKEKGLDLYFMTAMPENLDKYKERCLLINEQLYFVNKEKTVIPLPQFNYQDFSAKLSLLLQETPNRAADKLHFSSLEVANLLGIESLTKRAQVMGRIDWNKQRIWEKKANKAPHFTTHDLPHGIKLLGDYRQNPDGSIPTVGSGKRNLLSPFVKPDNCVMIAEANCPILKTTVMIQVNNYRKAADTFDEWDAVYVLARKATSIDSFKMVRSVGLHHSSRWFIENPNSMAVGEIRDLNLDNVQMTTILVQKAQDGSFLFYQPAWIPLTDIDMKRLPDTAMQSAMQGRRMLCSRIHALYPLVEALEQELPDALVSDLVVSPNDLGQVRLLWDNTWFGDPKRALHVFEENDASLAQTFGKFKQPISTETTTTTTARDNYGFFHGVQDDAEKTSLPIDNLRGKKP